MYFNETHFVCTVMKYSKVIYRYVGTLSNFQCHKISDYTYCKFKIIGKSMAFSTAYITHNTSPDKYLGILPIKAS